MKNYISATAFLCTVALPLWAQNNNGLLDQIEELGIKDSIQIPAAGGVHLATDIYLPITSDSMALNINVLGQQIYAQIIPKGVQLIVYPTMIDAQGNTVPNPNPYQLPMILSRTPYGKDGVAPAGNAIPLMGYAFVYQDVRGRFHSEGTYLPMYSDGWTKAPYHQHSVNVDMTPLGDPANGVYHQDGWDTYQYLLNQYQRGYDLDGDGNPETTATVCNGTMGLAGASAFAIPHFQLTAAHRLDTVGKGLRSMVSAIATAEHFRYTTYHNGVFREQLVREWLEGQLNDLDESATATDNNLQNMIHSPADYALLTTNSVIESVMDFLTEYKYPGSSTANAYPNSVMRGDIDVSHAPVNANGEGDPAGAFSRYTNMNVPTYHLTGWWDIFTGGQIATWNKTRNALTGSNQRLQKLVIGPWAHTTLSMQTTGDMTYPDNVDDVIGIAADGFDTGNLLNIDLAALFQMEPIRWFRYTMNENGYVRLGEPMVRIPKSNDWQDVGAFDVRIPSANYDLTLVQFLNFLTGQGDLPDMPVQVNLGFGITNLQIDIPNIGAVLPLPANPIQPPAATDFKNDVPDVRLYVVGPTDTLPDNAGVGNYWLAANTFPLPATDITYIPFYLHQNGSLDGNAPIQDEGTDTYTHDPDNPVLTVGGGNLFNDTPDGRESHGQMNLADSIVVSLTMDRADVMQYESAELLDTISMIGFPKATIYAASTPQGTNSGETDTDFMIRIVDVYPDGREFYVTEGVVNARARAYARSIYNGTEEDAAVFENIQIGQPYEFQFECQPVAYTFGKHHRIKVLVSSSNYPRYQSNPNLPLESGDFFRRQPNDGQTYTYQGQTLTARKADNSLYFSPAQASRIELPLYHYTPTGLIWASDERPAPAIQVFPNPTTDWVEIRTAWDGVSHWALYDLQGKQVQSFQTTHTAHRYSLQGLPAGMYRLEGQHQGADRQSVWITVVAKSLFGN